MPHSFLARRRQTRQQPFRPHLRHPIETRHVVVWPRSWRFTGPLRFPHSQVRGFPGSRCSMCRVSVFRMPTFWLPSFWVSRFGHPCSGFPHFHVLVPMFSFPSSGFLGFCVPRFPDSEFPSSGFLGLRVPGFPGSRIRGFWSSADPPMHNEWGDVEITRVDRSRVPMQAIASPPLHAP